MSVNHPALINAVTAAKRQLGPEQDGAGVLGGAGWEGHVRTRALGAR